MQRAHTHQGMSALSEADRIATEKTLPVGSVIGAALGILVLAGGMLAAAQPAGPKWMPQLTAPAEAGTLNAGPDELGRD